MKKIINLLLLTAIMQQGISQTETFDIVTYTPPKDWKKDAKPGVVNYSNANTTTGTFCIIAMYASTASTGDAEKDFNKDWKELVATPFKAKANPETETQTTEDGWKVVTGAALVKLDGNDLYMILTVVSGFGKTMSIRSSLNDQSYTAQVDALFETMELDKTATPSVNNNAQHPADNTATAPATGGTGKFGAMMYTAPARWSEQVFQDGVVFKPLDLPAEEHLAMQIMQPLNFSGSIEQALQQSYDEAAAMYNTTKKYFAGGAEYQKAEAQKSFNGWEYIRGKGEVMVGFSNELGLELFVIKINNRFERVAVLKSKKSCNMSRYFSADRLQYTNAIDNFLFSLQFSDGQESVFKSGTINGDGIIGVWQGISLQTSASSGIRYNVFSPVFLSNGQAYFGPKFPTEGLDGLNTRIPPELHRRDWGTYTFSNGRGVLKMPYADIPLRMEGNTLIIKANQTDHKFYQLPSVDGARFNGNYVMNEAYGKIPSISFTSDGRFTDNGAVKILYHEYIDCINPALAPGSGTYEVKDYTITFNYMDGRKIKIAFMGAGYDIKNQSPATLMMSYDENTLTRQ